MRKWMLRTHLVLSLFLGLFFVAICLSGSFLVLRTDIDRWQHPDLYKATPGHATLQTILTNATEANAGKVIDYFEYPRKEDGLFHVWLTTPDGKGPEQQVFIDPGSGKVLGQNDGEQSVFMKFMGNLHYYLLLEGVIGNNGAQLVEAIVGLVFLIVLVTGVFVWWPGIRKFASGFRIVRHKGKLVFQRDLHRSIGIVTSPILIVFALTGILFTSDAALNLFGGFQTYVDAPAERKTIKPGGEPLPLDQLIAKVQQVVPNGDPVYATNSVDPTQASAVIMNVGYNPSQYGNVTTYINQYTGDILWKSDPSSKLSIYQNLKYGLHFGTWGGEFSKILYVIIGVAPLFFMITGVTIWQLKARAKRRSKKRIPRASLPTSAA
ncbi:hypothetical protein Back11_42740 [Paenibacillus baekrokdamisoli]|uniref:Uncharacterized protein n=1 Tax=Paenibacillus baekrokdamisoli TaxID=1712516 RepID=A0A3G9JIS5_9BACL|nr:PepSY-associated TM helix domain-containing protein [Paenibacillus baekrokdamisoli]MBB3068023.1 putative iron-regulated membrane protein [Paenibacillus baekrokdamisoli]BBH22929.1 hypothetical protein Back11_42740 [Paenibacillus baekrokdamisoli]